MIRPCIALLVGALALSGCTGDADRSREAGSSGVGVHLNIAGREVPETTPGDPLRYVLNMTKSGCLWAATEGAGPPQPRIDVVWPAGTAAERGDDGAVRIVAEDGTALARVGGALNALEGTYLEPDLGSTTFACRLGDGDARAVYVQSPG
jgi:hypothetical protein